MFALFPLFCFANEIVINEIAWMGQKDSYSKEWIELYNNTDSDINLSGWILKVSKTDIALKGVIAKKSFYLLEHNSDNTIVDKKADLIYKKALNNKGEVLLLINKSKEEVDRIDCSQGWFMGDNKTKQTMERIDSTKDGNERKNWKKSENENGTPAEKNSEKIIEKKENPISEITTNNNTPIPIETYFIAGIVAILSAGSVLAVKQTSR